VTRLKLPNPMAPFLPSALGATEEPLLSMAAAYAVFRQPRALDRSRPALSASSTVTGTSSTPAHGAGRNRSSRPMSPARWLSLMRGPFSLERPERPSSLGHELAGKDWDRQRLYRCLVYWLYAIGRLRGLDRLQ
jgi:hypothetical protein